MNQKLMRLAALSALFSAAVTGSVCQAAVGEASGNLFQLVELPGMSSGSAAVTIAAAKCGSGACGGKNAKAEAQHCGSKEKGKAQHCASKGLCTDKGHCQHCASSVHKGKGQHCGSKGDCPHCNPRKDKDKNKAGQGKCGAGACGGKAAPGNKP